MCNLLDKFSGVGIDDMFVIMQCFNNIESREENEGMSLPEKIALTMRRAGVAITLTSATDIAALLSAAFTIFPALHSVCITAVFAILFIFLMQSTWFVAWLTLDQRRIEEQRDSFFPCLVRNEWSKEKAQASRNWTKTLMDFLSNWAKTLMYFLSNVICHMATKVWERNTF